MLPYLLGKDVAKPIREAFITTSTVRRGQWKLYLKTVTPGGKGTTGMKRRVAIEAGALFDLEKDLGEKNEISDQHPDVVTSLTAEFEKYHRELKANQRPPLTVGKE